jgi:hypothetical protein
LASLRQKLKGKDEMEKEKKKGRREKESCCKPCSRFRVPLCDLKGFIQEVS